MSSEFGAIMQLGYVVENVDVDALLTRRQLQDRVIQSGKMPTGLQEDLSALR